MYKVPAPLLFGGFSGVGSLHCVPDFAGGIKLQVPPVVMGLVTLPSLAFFPSLTHFPSPDCVSWELLWDKALRANSLVFIWFS